MAEEINKLLANEEMFNEVAKAAFSSMDADQSNSIDKSELKKMMDMVSKDAGVPECSQEDINNVMTSLDTNKDGVIDLDEFKVLLRETLKQAAGL